MAFTKVAAAGISTGNSLTIQELNTVGVITAATVQVGSASTIHTTGIDLGSGNITSHNINSTGIITATGAVITGNLEVQGTTTTLDSLVTEVDKLEVAANNTNVAVAVTQSGTGDILNLFDGSTEVFTVTDGGNVGIGITNPTSLLTLRDLSAADESLLRIEAYRPGIRFIDVNNSTTDGEIVVNDGSLKIGLSVESSESALLEEKLRITSTGNVGIGTQSPSHRLDVVSGNTSVAEFSGPANALVEFKGSGYVEAKIQCGGEAVFGSTNNYPTSFVTNNNEKVRITTDGKVGIGTNIPRGGLHVYSDATGELPAQPHALVISRASASSNRLLLGVDENSGYGVITSVDPGTAWTHTTINPSSGNVGIGLTNPSAKLHISSGGATQMLISNKSASMSDGDTIGTIDFTAGPSFTTNARVAGLVEGTSEAGGDLIFETRQDGGSLTEKVRITSTGLVGIGSESPRYGLDVYSNNILVSGSSAGNLILEDRGVADGSRPFALLASNDGNFTITNANRNASGTTTSSVERLRITSGGLVGIGTDNPSTRLHVHGGTNDTPAYFDTGNANGAHIRFLQGGSVRHYLGCGGGISLGDKDDLTMRAYDNIIFATANSSTRKATLKNSGEFIIGATSGAAGLVHVQHNEITAAAPSLGWPHYFAESDDNAKIALHLETAGNSSVSTAGQGASVVLRMGQYYDSRAVITTLAAGGSSPSDQGTGHGKDLLVKGGRSDNGNGKYGGRLFLNGGSGYNSNAYDTNYGHCVIQGMGGLTGIGELSPNYPLDISHTNNSAYSSSAFIAPSVEIHNQSTTDGTAAGIHMYVTGSGANAAAAHINCVHTGNGSGALCFGTRHNAGNHSERLRITSNGDFWVSGNSMNHLKNEYRGSVSVTGTNNESFAFEIQGASYGSGGLLYVYATSGNVVVNFSAEILVNHSNDVTIKSMSGAYTQARIRVKTDSNARAAIYLGRNAGYASGTTSLNWKFIPYGGTYAYTTESTNNGTDHTHVTASGSFNLTAAGGGSANVNAAGSKNFLIDHPLVGLATTTRLAHAAVEGPECNTMYRGKVDLVGGTVTVNIDTNSRMTEGTFEALNQNVQCFTTNETGWTPIKGSVSGNLLTITAQDNTCTDTISWMVVGERKDQDIINNRATDSEGRFIPEITDEYDASQFAVYTDPVESDEENL